ncbi:MAG TPA: hypothetical protein VF492_11675, partial [Verrucomicrobiae bacterium]
WFWFTNFIAAKRRKRRKKQNSFPFVPFVLFCGQSLAAVLVLVYCRMTGHLPLQEFCSNAAV